MARSTTQKTNSLPPVQLNTTIEGIGQRGDIFEGDFEERDMLLAQGHVDIVDPSQIPTDAADGTGDLASDPE